MFPSRSAFIGGSFFLLGLGSFHLVPFSPPFLGALLALPTILCLDSLQSIVASGILAPKE